MGLELILWNSNIGKGFNLERPIGEKGNALDSRLVIFLEKYRNLDLYEINSIMCRLSVVNNWRSLFLQKVRVFILLALTHIPLKIE